MTREHDGWVAYGDEGREVYAVCSCGWQSSPRLTSDDPKHLQITADWMEHKEAVYGVWKERLRATA